MYRGRGLAFGPGQTLDPAIVCHLSKVSEAEAGITRLR
jgi:hypothetical protein